MKEKDVSWYRTSYAMARDTRITANDVMLYSVLLDQCTECFECTVSYKEIAELLGERFSFATFFRCLNRLERCGYIQRTRTGKANNYTLADVIGLKRKKHSKHSLILNPPEDPERGQPEVKLKYGKYQNVLLTVAEFDSLMSDFGTAKANSYVQKCDSYCQSTGKSYADYNATIRRWISADAEKQLPADEVKRQEFEEINEYLSLVNQFD